MPPGTDMSSSLFIDTLNGIKRERPPVWFMRQAGRCFPSYNKLRENYSFIELMENPGLAPDVTLLPVWKLGVDAAIDQPLFKHDHLIKITTYA